MKKTKKLIDELALYFSVNSPCELPLCKPSDKKYIKNHDENSSQIKFEFLGTVGNDTKLQFKANPGGWTVTLAPRQLSNLIPGDKKYYE